ncbi:MAG: isoamylase early set domain-containing protein [Candidatus Scalindua sp.]|nr:isoamylase early set domain-containing protein [Candidatus Scalindua sp.]
MKSTFITRFRFVYQKTRTIIVRMANELSDYVSSSEKKEEMNHGIEKEFLGDICRVTFRLPESAAPDADSVCVVGDFNGWDRSENPMEKTGNGDYVVRLDLERGKEYQFRYLIDGTKWENDWDADRYVQNTYGDSDNSLVIT